MLLTLTNRLAVALRAGHCSSNTGRRIDVDEPIKKIQIGFAECGTGDILGTLRFTVWKA
jgi:hypothetical protein